MEKISCGILTQVLVEGRYEYFFFWYYCSLISRLKITKPFFFQTYIRELAAMGLKNPENLAIPSVRNNVRMHWHVVHGNRKNFKRFRDDIPKNCLFFQVAFLVTVVGSTSFIALLAGQLPGVQNSYTMLHLWNHFFYHFEWILPHCCVLQDWGFFVPYLVGSISLVVLAIGSVAPGYFCSQIPFLLGEICVINRLPLVPMIANALACLKLL